MSKHLTKTQQLIKEKRKYHDQLWHDIEVAEAEKKFAIVKFLVKRVNKISSDIMRLEEQDYRERNGK